MSEAEEPASASIIAERRAEADRWLEIARDDVDVALAATGLPRPRAGIAAYKLATRQSGRFRDHWEIGAYRSCT